MRWAILGAALALTACATAPPARFPVDQRRSDLTTYSAQLREFEGEVQQLLDDFEALRANSHFAGLEEKIRALAARRASEANTDASEPIVAGLYTMTLGELLVFPRFLALSTRWITLDATRARLETLRLELWARRITLDRETRAAGVVQPVRIQAGDAPVDPALVERPVPFPLSCLAYVVGNLAFANCHASTP